MFEILYYILEVIFYLILPIISIVIILLLIEFIFGKKIFGAEKEIQRKNFSTAILFIFYFLMFLPFIQDYYHYLAKSNGYKKLNDPMGIYYPAFDFFTEHKINYQDGIKNGDARIEKKDYEFVYNYDNNLIDGPFVGTEKNYTWNGNFYLGDMIGKITYLYNDGTKIEEIIPKSLNRFWGLSSGYSFIITYYPDGRKLINTKKYGFWNNKEEGPYYGFNNDESIEISNFNYSVWNQYSYSDGPYLIINPDESIEAGEYDNIEGIKDQKYIKEYKNGDIEVGQYENDIKIDSKIIDNK